MGDVYPSMHLAKGVCGEAGCGKAEGGKGGCGEGGLHPLNTATDGYQSGRYASYRNVFLLINRLQMLWAKKLQCVVCMNSLILKFAAHRTIQFI